MLPILQSISQKMTPQQFMSLGAFKYLKKLCYFSMLIPIALGLSACAENQVAPQEPQPKPTLEPVIEKQADPTPAPTPTPAPIIHTPKKGLHFG